MSDQHDDRRVAIYFAPRADSDLFRFGRACLGRDAVTGEEIAAAAFDGLPPDRWRAITASPRMYGFHATLKPPFRLSTDRTRGLLIDRLEEFAAARQPFDAGLLRVARISNFVALVLRDHCEPLSELAGYCVSEFDDFRAAPTNAELARRRQASLTRRQQALLDDWGYPYVFDEWRFHMTLASGLDRSECEHVREELETRAAAVCTTPLEVDAVCLFEQAATNAPFLQTRRFPFGGARP